ncbi:hypothetical protein NDU88_006359 [Pleurodeles waltl]|uniref:ABC-2 type transporter transmembrane domain-containing protein n=1 Tax=Pleurodeles waltl TaxID=8319 RepID=A0AAV7X0X9_PLEWA|nr:hypothetical protein NDU88_006359 [Pleurodeles waltl]
MRKQQNCKRFHCGTSHDGKKHPDTFAGPPTIEEHVGGNVTVVEKLATHYTQTPQYQETRRELDRLSSENKKVNVIFVYKKAKYKTNFCHQLRWVFDRSFKNMIRNPQVSLAQIFATIVLSLVIGAIYFGVKNDRFGIQNSAQNVGVAGV